MYAVSQEYKDKLFSVGTKQRRIVGMLDDIPFTENDILAESLTITNKCLNSNDINLGGVFIGQLEMTFLPSFKQNVPRGTWKDRCVSISIGLLLDAEEDIWEDVPIQPFYIQEANHNKNGVSIKCFDAMNFFDHNLNFDTTAGSVYDFASSACEACDVELGMTQAQVEALPNGQEVLGVYPVNDMKTWRDFISWIAVSIGGYATIDRLGRLVFRTWHLEPDWEIDIYNREISGSWSDFSTYYTGLSVVDMDKETTRYYSVEPDTGLTMTLGNNPLMQYGTDETRTRQAMAILTALQSFVYTPFNSSSFIDPAIDIGDIVSYTDGLAGDESICCVHKLSYSYRKGMKLTGFGKNPALFGAQSKTDKNIAGLLSRQDESMIVTHTYENTAEINVDSIPISIIKIRFATINAKMVKLLAQIQMDVTADAQGDGIVTATMYNYLDGDLLPYTPQASWDNDGIHPMNLIYWLQNLEGGVSYEWEVALKVEGGTATIDKAWIHALLEAQGLVATEDWDGYIEVEDSFSLMHHEHSVYAYEDEVSIDFNDVEFVTASDSFSLMHHEHSICSYEDSWNIVTQKDIYNLISEDGQYRLASEDGEYNIESEE